MKKAVYILLISLGLALIFNYLFFDKLIGISVFVMALFLIGAVLLIGLHEQVSLRKTWWLISLIFFFALMPGIRANEFLTFLNVCALFGLLMVWAQSLAGTPAFVLRLRDYIALIILVPFKMVGRAISTATLISQFHSSIEKRDVWVRVLKGIIMAVPVLIIFGALFSQADLAFSQFLKGFVDITISERSMQYLILLSIAFVAALSFLSYVFSPGHTKPESAREQHEQPETGAQSGKSIEAMVFLGLIAALFLLFIGFQITYLFGGEANIINAGFTYAEYARRGFWELLAVAILSLVVLLAFEKYADVESKQDKRFLIPALILIAEIGVVIASAFKRLSLYIDAYGMTIQRFYVAGFIMLLSVLFILLAVKFIASKREQFFAFGTLLSFAAFLIIVNLMNPDAFIAKTNIKQYNRTGKIDASYMRELSADAEPQKLELYATLEGEDKKILRTLLENQKTRLQKHSGNWQSTNLARIRAMRLLEEL